MSEKTLNTNAKTAVITGMSYLDVDRILASFVLAKIIARKTNAPVDISVGYPIPRQIFAKISKDEQLNVVDSMSLAQNSIEITNITEKVNDINWKQTESGIELEMLNLNGEKIDPSNSVMNLKSGKYDSAYLLGVRSAKYLLKLLSNTTESDLSDLSLTSINIVNKRDIGIEADQYINDKVNSFCAAVFAFAQKHSYKLSEQELTDLLSGIYWKTNALRNYYTTEETFNLAKELVTTGASLQAANQNIFASLDENTLQTWSEALLNIEINDEVAISMLDSKIDFDKFANQQISPLLSPLAFADASIGILIAPTTDSKTMAIVSANQTSINLTKKLSELSAKGDNQQVKILSDLNKHELRSKLLGLLNAKTPKEKPESTPTQTLQVQESKQEPKRPIASNYISAKPVQSEKSPASEKNGFVDLTKKKETADDPLAPAEFDFSDLEDEDDGNTNGGNSFGFGGSSDPLPKAKG